VRAWENLKRAREGLAAREVGVPAGQPRWAESQVATLGSETAYHRLPVLDSGGALVDGDGEFLFMLDFDALDGGAPLG